MVLWRGGESSDNLLNVPQSRAGDVAAVYPTQFKTIEFVGVTDRV